MESMLAAAPVFAAGLDAEFNRQVETLLSKGYPALAGLSDDAFVQHVEPLRACLGAATPADDDATSIPFVLVVTHELVATEAAMPRVEVKGQPGVVNMRPVEPGSFAPIEGLRLPHGTAYLLVDVLTGRDTLNLTPAEALQRIRSSQRSPLTIDEGVALVTHMPDVLRDKERFNAFSMLGSRRSDQRVPALWISYGQPRLGWCWERNPHTWLGSASCRDRIGPS